MKQRILVFVLLLGVFVPAGALAKPLSVFVSVLPQKFFVNAIGGDRVHTEVMVLPGASPATYEPKPRQMADLSKADVYFAIGVPFEAAWLRRFKAANPSLVVVHTDNGIQKRMMAAHHHEDEDHAGKAQSHGDEGKRHGDEDDHNGVKDPHIWLNPALVKIQARHIAEALSQADPENRDYYIANLTVFLGQIDDLDQRIRSVFASAPARDRKFMVFHPSWGYFADAYGLIQVPIEIEGKSPSPMELSGLIKHAREENTRVIFVQPQFSDKSAGVIAGEIGATVKKIDPLAANWAENLLEAATTFATAMKY